MATRPELQVLLDFDGTLVEPNVAILLVEKFCPDGPTLAHEVDEQLHRGEITLRQAWARQVALLPPDRIPEMVDFAVANTPFRGGARELLALLEAHAVPTTIVSGGLDFYIHPILAQAGIRLPVLCDGMEKDAFGALQATHPYGHPTCRLCGICKAQIVRRFAGPAVRTVFIGDGSTDRYAAEVADLVFARRRLKSYCERAGIPYVPFEEFGPVTAQFHRWLDAGEPLPPLRALGVAGSACPISQELLAARAPSRGDAGVTDRGVVSSAG